MWNILGSIGKACTRPNTQKVYNEKSMTLLEDRRGPWWDEDEFKFHHYLLCGARVVSSPLWSISSRDRPAHQPSLQRWKQQPENQIPLTGRKVEAKVARGAPRSPSAVHGDRDADLRAHALRVPPHHGRPTVLCAWAPPNWVLGPGPLGQGSCHLLCLWLRAFTPATSTLQCLGQGQPSPTLYPRLRPHLGAELRPRGYRSPGAPT